MKHAYARGEQQGRDEMPTVRNRNLKKLRRMKQKAKLKIRKKMNNRQHEGA